jgi:mannitol-specific phosphotransferase system IIBC component
VISGAGLVATPSPGSIFAYLAAKGSANGVVRLWERATAERFEVAIDAMLGT